MIPAPGTKRTARKTSLQGKSFRFLGVAALFLFFGLTGGQAATAPETELKAAFLYNFAKFVEWPAEAFSSETAPIQLAVFGDEEFGAKLRSLLSDKKAHGRSFEGKTITCGGPPNDCLERRSSLAALTS